MKSVLITGGAGFWGRGFVRKCLADHHFERICVYSRDEHKHAAMRQDLGDDPRLRWFLGDVRDQARLERALEGVEVVVHAAALKRIEVGFSNPDEMLKTNVLGALNLVEAARRAGVDRVVAISTDKAWSPRSPYGLSKALAEALFLSAANLAGERGPKYAVVRYGNIVGSTGSIIPIWRGLIAAGQKTVPVTDPQCTRFWMRLEDAIDLVLDTIQTMQGGELAIPVGTPAFAVGDLATAMNVDVEITGLPEWEKLHEGLRDGVTSDKARRMTVREIREELKRV